jgi:uncharacterized membrane protein
MQKRPTPNLQLTPTDNLLETLGYLTLLATWANILYHFKSLPDIIPTHYNLAGQADLFGAKTTIFFLPLLGTLLFIAMTILNKYPHKFNYPITITEANAQRQYTNAVSMFRYLKVSIVLVFGLITFQTIRHADHPGTGLGIWFLPIVLAVIFIPIIYFSMQSFNAK